MINNYYEHNEYTLQDNITMSDIVITKNNVTFIRTMLLQPHGNKLISIPVTGGTKNTNFKITDYVYTLLGYYQKQYSSAHRGKGYKGKHKDLIGMSRLVHMMAKFFVAEEPWIWKDNPEFDKNKYQIDVLYSLQCVKKIFNQWIPDQKIRTQSDTLVCLMGWQLSRQRENADGDPVRGFIDFYDDWNASMEPKDGIEDYSKISKAKAKELMQVHASPTIEDLFEEGAN